MPFTSPQPSNIRRWDITLNMKPEMDLYVLTLTDDMSL